MVRTTATVWEYTHAPSLCASSSGGADGIGSSGGAVGSGCGLLPSTCVGDANASVVSAPPELATRSPGNRHCIVVQQFRSNNAARHGRTHRGTEATRSHTGNGVCMSCHVMGQGGAPPSGTGLSHSILLDAAPQPRTRALPVLVPNDAAMLRRRLGRVYWWWWWWCCCLS